MNNFNKHDNWDKMNKSLGKYKLAKRLFHKEHFRPRQLCWRILPNIYGKNNSNSIQILPENKKETISFNSFFWVQHYSDSETRQKDWNKRKLQASITLEHTT